ncbi:hypothetical protein lerEdw1_018596 [Lerista edwardsae]|nr:hypothetical protein lerEdw1_018596 [Lerista edwardsae]
MDPISALLLFAFTMMLFWKMGTFWNRSSQDLPPGPRPLPLIGNLHIIDLKRPHRTMQKLSSQYGPVFSLHMGFQKMVVLTGYETVKEALVNQADAFAERPHVPIFEDFAKDHGEILAPAQ